MSSSTPSKNKTAVRSQTGITHNQVSQLKPDVMEDLEKAQSCKFDRLLKYFLYLVLHEQSAERRSLNELQGKIEVLQERLDCHGEDDREERQRTVTEREPEEGRGRDPVGALDSAASTGREDQVDPPNAVEELDTLKAQRDQQLDKIFDDCLQAVLPICNEQHSPLRQHLADYCSVKAAETERYAPYVSACNYALDRMKSLPNLPLRLPSSLDLCLHRSDPKIIQSKYPGSSKSVERKPDVIGTSRVAAKDSGDPAHDYTCPPGKPFTWAQTLFPNEFKMVEKKIQYQQSKVYTKDRQVTVECDAAELKFLYDLDDGPEIQDGESGHQAKRQKLEPPAEQPTSSSSKRRSSSKRAKGSKASSTATTSRDQLVTIPVNVSKAAVDARTQCALYGLEMMSYDLGVHHAIALLFSDSHLWIWYYDRQGIMQSDGIDFVQDLPRFLVLLLAFQRFTLEDWGVIEALNPTAVQAHTPDDRLALPTKRTRRNSSDGRRARAQPITRFEFQSIQVLESPGGHPTNLIINNHNDDYLSHKPHCLPGRATAVLGASAPDSNLPDLACKIYHPEVTRQNEGKMLEHIYEIVESKDPLMKKHLPDMLFYGDLPRCTTQRVRSMSGKAWKGHRTTRLVVSQKAQPLTTLAGSQFIKSWLEAAKCHAFLWKHGVEHGDPSLWNIMYSVQHRCGVLADYDLSVFRHLPRVLGTDRTGTIPFMALDLLRAEYWNGKLERKFYHELEAFIWILVFVFLRYQDGRARKDTLVERWMTADYNACREAKFSLMDFNIMNAAETQVQNDFRNEWPLASTLLPWALDAHNRRVQKLRRPGVVVSTDFADVWEDFLAQLKFSAAESPGLQYLENLMDALDLEKLLDDDIPVV
ncbi:hypothetical protein LshimejAT787_1702330 [Lyophyllum shimeji]|uniref:Fungal-type protein kinase domain-containing protein n=1 Tax=Lyophyllum shimeji TaxID=47721 RepID=A0A9P3UVY7_LYOSH|nr:hypothetical protein LshimejAT787_1702330 [Lyophyllum shimeji]